MTHLHNQFQELLKLIDVEADVLTATRERLALARKVAAKHPEGRKSYSSGSIPAHTHIQPHSGSVSDGDGGIILNRVKHPSLGPDRDGEAPHDITDELVAFVAPQIRELYPKARVHKSRRGLKIYFCSPVDGTDVTVDLIVALQRRDGRGLWIPDLDKSAASKNAWSASDPVGHVELLNSAPDALRRTRRKAIRLLKAWNAQASKPGFSSHNLSVWAYEFITGGIGLVNSVHTVLEQASLRLQEGKPTKDPHGVSPDLKPLIPHDDAERRLRLAAAKLEEAIHDPDNIEAVQQALDYLFPKTMSEASNGFSAASRVRTTGQLGFAGPSLLIPKTRSWSSS
ncbi:hypothetical protein [Streptomyces sp. NPDC005407]|uniref:hypothetical protein n=1 Tax=Streptomyces sp. NPDC005407 TaxID=3155340 RepID=UPI0033B9DF86